MKLTRLRISNFQSFGPEPTAMGFESITYLLGPNGTGKTAVLQALVRLFGIEPGLRRIQGSDFHLAPGEIGGVGPTELWIEAQFEFDPAQRGRHRPAGVPEAYANALLQGDDGVPRLRLRLQARLDEDGEIEENLHYVLQADARDEPQRTLPVLKQDRNAIQVHYLPARRDPSNHISYAANALLGRLLRAAHWQGEREKIASLTQKISTTLTDNAAVECIGEQLGAQWAALHKGSYYASPGVAFDLTELDNLLSHLTIGFTPRPGGQLVDFSRLSDGQQSLLYVALVLTVQAIDRQALGGVLDAFDVHKLRPACYTLLAVEEPESSLSPHYLGRLMRTLTQFAAQPDAQALVATHAAELLQRVPPEQVRHLRLNKRRETMVRPVVLPPADDPASRYVREALQTFPALYFARLVMLVEGESEQLLLARLLQARGIARDDASIAILPLAGRHASHFWRLLHGLGIAQVTLLDLGLGRQQGGWARVEYAIDQLLRFPPLGITLDAEYLNNFPGWNAPMWLLDSKYGQGWISFLETAGVFFAAPLDLDYAMLQQFGSAYGVEPSTAQPDEQTVAAVLGHGHGELMQYGEADRLLFEPYLRLFRLGSAAAAHLDALAQIDDTLLDAQMPAAIGRLLDLTRAKLARLIE